MPTDPSNILQVVTHRFPIIESNELSPDPESIRAEEDNRIFQALFGTPLKPPRTRYDVILDDDWLA